MTDKDRQKAPGARLKAARKEAGYRSAREAALMNEWSETTYRAHEGGWRTIGVDDAERYAARFRFDGVQVSARGILFGDNGAYEPVEEGAHVVSVVGVVSAGGLIETSSEQTGDTDTLFEITVPFPVPDDTIAFRVEGTSGYPKYEENDILLCSRAGQPIDTLLNTYAAVRTADGNRYLKRILPGTRRGHFHLESFNAPLMTDVRLKWASGISITVHERHWKALNQALGESS